MKGKTEHLLGFTLDNHKPTCPDLINLFTKENLFPFNVFPICILSIIHPFRSVNSNTWNLCAVFNKSWCECRKCLGKMLCVKKRSCYSVMD